MLARGVKQQNFLMKHLNWTAEQLYSSAVERQTFHNGCWETGSRTEKQGENQLPPPKELPIGDGRYFSSIFNWSPKLRACKINEYSSAPCPLYHHISPFHRVEVSSPTGVSRNNNGDGVFFILQMNAYISVVGVTLLKTAWMSEALHCLIRIFVFWFALKPFRNISIKLLQK